MKRNLGRNLHKIAKEGTAAHPNIGYVLITCSQGDATSEVDVHMTYQGDPFLLSFLLENGAEKILHEAGIEEA